MFDRTLLPSAAPRRATWCCLLPKLALCLGMMAANAQADMVVLGEHSSGGMVLLNRETQKAQWVTTRGIFPLWDGIHPLRDGAQVRVHSGVVVKDDFIVEQLQPSIYSPEAAQALCRELETRVCGADPACAAREPCQVARQMLQMIEEDLRHGPVDASGPSLERQCQEALANPAFFAACPVPSEPRP